MTTTDPTTILREAIKAVVIESEADDVLATRIPQACQTCKGSGTECVKAYSDGVPMIERPCPDCPTILTLLLYGWNVAKWRRAVTKGGQVRTPYGHLWMTAPNLLAALREVPT